MYYENEFYLFYFVHVWSIHMCVSVETRDQRWMSSYSTVLSWNLELRLCWPGWPGSYLTRAGVTDMLHALSVYEAAAGGSKLSSHAIWQTLCQLSHLPNPPYILM